MCCVVKRKDCNTQSPSPAERLPPLGRIEAGLTVYNSDLIILLETWSRSDSKSYTPPNYRELRIPSIKQPNVKNGRDSGWIIVWFKEHLWQYIQPVKKGTTHIWIKLKKEILCLDEDLYLCASYIPPRESPYYNEDIFSTLQSEIIYFPSSVNGGSER